MTGTPARPSARVMFRPPSSITMAMRWASRAYVAGPTLEDAVRVCDRLATQKLATSIGFWNAAGDDPRAVAHAYLVGLETIARFGLDCSVSVKASAMALFAGAHGRSAETRN